jgi:tRNA(fMet)-specific endonuclease VapC
MLHMLDIDTASYIVRSRAAQVEAKLSAIEPSMLCISAMTRAELLYGLKRLSPDHRLRAGVHQFLKIVRALPWGAEAADLYAEMRNQLAAAGQLIGENRHDDRGTFSGHSGGTGHKHPSPLPTNPGASHFGKLVGRGRVLSAGRIASDQFKADCVSRMDGGLRRGWTQHQLLFDFEHTGFQAGQPFVHGCVVGVLDHETAFQTFEPRLAGLGINFEAAQDLGLRIADHLLRTFHDFLLGLREVLFG